MDLLNVAARLHRLPEGGWERHANPWSGLTRFPILPLLALAIWSRVWLGWGCLVPIAAILAWILINPRAFPPPETTRHWLSRAVMGERVWMNRSKVPIPAHHAGAAMWLTALTATGIPLLVWGLWQLQVWPTVVGVGLVLVFKLWFLDRMVWLFDDMARTTPAYAAWVR